MLLHDRGRELYERALRDPLDVDDSIALLSVSLYLLQYGSVRDDWPGFSEALSAVREHLRATDAPIPLTKQIRSGSGPWRDIESVLEGDRERIFEFESKRSEAHITARLSGLSDPSFLPLARALCRGNPSPQVELVRLALSSEYDSVVETFANPHAPVGEREADPRHCAPEALEHLAPLGWKRAKPITPPVAMLWTARVSADERTPRGETPRPNDDEVADTLGVATAEVTSVRRGLTRRRLHHEDRLASLGLHRDAMDRCTSPIRPPLIPGAEHVAPFHAPSFLAPIPPRRLYRSLVGLDPIFGLPWIKAR